MVKFNEPPVTRDEIKYIAKAISSGQLCGDKIYSKKCQEWFEEHLKCSKALLTPSCTAALEMAAILIDVKPGDQIIMPSYTFVSTANAFVLRGADIVFVDIRQDTMNIDETKIECAITNKTKAIVAVHYAGVACEMDSIMEIAKRYNLCVIEDAAQGMSSTYKGKPLGTIGHIGTYSFHETKNYTSGGEGGLLIINEDYFSNRAELIREKGTNRSKFFRGQVDKYTWVDLGSSFLPSELQAAFLWGQLKKAAEINHNRLATWNVYYKEFKFLENNGLVELPVIPLDCQHNAHMFYLKLKGLEQRIAFIEHLKAKGITAAFHYIPLHSSPAGLKFGMFHDIDINTTKESERLVRLPIYYKMNKEDQQKVILNVIEFFS